PPRSGRRRDLSRAVRPVPPPARRLRDGRMERPAARRHEKPARHPRPRARRAGLNPGGTMLEDLKREVLEANRDIERKSLAGLTWGNVSGIDRDEGLVVIKPSGVPYSKLRVEDMVVIDLENRKVEGALRPSVDAITHVL